MQPISEVLSDMKLGQTIAAQPHQAVSQERILSLGRWSNMPLHTRQSKRFTTFKPRKGAVEALKAAREFSERKLGHWFLTLAGATGTGKTHLAYAVGWEWIERGIKVKYYQAGELLDELRRGIHNESQEQYYSFDRLMAMMKTVPLLVIDDLGVEQSTPWARERLDIIMNRRYEEELPTLVTTNEEPTSLAPRIVSRLSEGNIIVIRASDYRMEKAKR